MNSSRRAIAAAADLRPRAGLSAWSALILGGTLAIAVGLRLFRLADAGYWFDEVISTFAARAPAGEILRSITASDTHPPLYHILLHYWGALFGYELVPLRLMSVALGVLCVPAVWLLGRQLFGAPAGLIAAALMAVAPFQIFHGQQARMYPLLTLVVLLATLAFTAAWRHGGVWRWALLGLAAAAGFYTHVYFAFSLLGLNLWALAESVRMRRLERGQWAGLILAQLVAVLLFSPFLLNMFALTSGVVSNFWIRSNTPWDWVIMLVAVLNYATVRTREVPLWYLLLAYLPALGALVGGLIYAVVRAVRRPEERSNWLLLLCAVLTPCLVATALSLTVRPILLDRSLIGTSGPLFVLLAGAVVRSWPSRLTLTFTTLFALSIVFVLPAVYPSTPRPHGLQPAIDTIFAERQPGEAVIVHDWPSFDLMALRYPDAADVFVGAPANKIAIWQRRMALMGWHTPEQVGPPAGYAANYRRVWVTYSERHTYPEDWAVTRDWLQANARLVEGRAVGVARVELYELLP